MNNFERFNWPTSEANAEAWEQAQRLTYAESRQQFPPMWVIYDHPLDFPNSWVVRKWYGAHSDHSWMAIAPSLDAARLAARMDGASVHMVRSPGDDKVVAEVWV